MADFAAARLNMVESQVRTQDVTDTRIQDAMRAIPRERFVPEGETWRAYADMEVEYAPGRVLLKPRDVAKLIQALRPMPGDRVLAISAPYAGAVMEALDLNVTRIAAEDALPAGSFDIIVCEGAVSRAPDAWRQALAEEGRLGVVERDGAVGKACLYICADGGIGRREIFDSFAPMLSGFEAHRSFAL
jgi:protein-L-isoaspartate(D-aspartate) O-methyltransferase